MKKFTKKVLAIFLSVLMAVCAAAMPVSAFEMPKKAAEKQSEKVDYVEGEVIVVLKNTAPKTYLKASRTVANFGAGISMNESFTFKKKSGDIRALVLKSNTKSTKEIMKNLKSNDQVKYAFPNYKVKASDITNDTYSEYQWALDNKGYNNGTAGLDTNPETLWTASENSDEEQVVAIVDTGIDFEHEDLKDVLWNNPYGSKLVGKHGYDFSDTIKDHTPLDDNGHGTHVAGIIAGVPDNEKGISGINKKNTKIMACKFLDEEGSGATDDALAAYEYILRAIDLGTNVVAVNNSWGGYGDKAEQMLFDEIFDALGEKGAISVVAAGNEANDLSNVVDEEMSFWFDDEYYVTPASSESAYCLTVAATNEKDELAGFSNYSDKYVDIAAPGTGILSSVSYNCFNPSAYSASQKTALCYEMQDYNGEIVPTSFGYPKFFMLADESDPNYSILGKNYQISQSDDYFGKEGKSINIEFKDVIDEEDADSLYDYSFEIPYSIEDENKPYSISFMLKGNKSAMGIFADVPADYDVAKNYTELDFDSYFTFTEESNYWSHKILNVDPSDKHYSKKLKSKDRKLVFIVEAYKNDTFIRFEDFAVSNQNCASEDFGKYDFYNGTSMATPYVTGAVALVNSAYPEADTAEVINIIKNTGRKSASLEGKTENARVLSLDNTEKTPAMILSAKYNDEGNVELKGSFKGETTFKVNGEIVQAISQDISKAVLPDNSYNTKKTVITAENENGFDSVTVLLSKKSAPELNPKVIGIPMMNYFSGYYMPMGTIAIPAGDKSYFVSESGEIGSIYYDEYEDAYIYDDMVPQISLNELFKNPKGISIKSAVYFNGRIYFDAVNEVSSDYSGTTLGYDGAFGYIDLSTGKTAVLCETPNASAIGSSLAVYSGNVYLIGGCNADDGTFISDVYKYNTSKKAFDKTETPLTEGRAFTRFIQYGTKLIGVYGAVESGALPKITVFNGTSWSDSSVEAESDDFQKYFIGGKDVNVFCGNIGYSAKGVYLNGPYIYGYGDTYIYTVPTDKLTASKYSFSNVIGEGKLLATTLPGCFIGYPVLGDEGEDVDIGVGGLDGIAFDEDDFDEDENIAVAYCYNINTGYAELDDSSLKYAYISNDHNRYYAYGDKTAIKVAPENGHELTSVTVGGVKLAAGVTKTTVTFNKSKITVKAQTKMLAPNKVTGVKVKLDSKKKNYTVSWKKPKRAQGYQVQTYVKGKWKTVKTLSLGSTVKCTVSKSKAGKKFRVRAYAKYSDKKYYGAWSSAAAVK